MPRIMFCWCSYMVLPPISAIQVWGCTMLHCCLTIWYGQVFLKFGWWSFPLAMYLLTLLLNPSLTVIPIVMAHYCSLATVTIVLSPSHLPSPFLHSWNHDKRQDCYLWVVHGRQKSLVQVQEHSGICRDNRGAVYSSHYTWIIQFTTPSNSTSCCASTMLTWLDMSTSK